MKSLLTAGYLCGIVALFFLPPAFGIAALVIGIVVLAKGRVGHGVALIVLAVTCGISGMYIGWIGMGNLVNLSLQAPVSSESAQSPTAVAQPTVQDWHVVSVETRITETNSVFSAYSWKVTIRNDSAVPAIFYGTVEFQDADGFELSHDHVNLDRDIQVPAVSEGIFTGLQDIENTKKVARTIAKISKQ